ncbi:MAG TPA: polyprenyl synthetase family protein, partial [Aggregatilineaceae bacterium]|nr:polyprenyl synthetase family protein [Aggregatilineaceae bacterium]
MAGEQPYKDPFGQIRADIEAEMRAARQEQTAVAPMLWEIVDYVFGWDLTPEQTELSTKVSGKKIRPLFMALVAKAICGDYHHVLPAGAALEFLHNFTLIHDDVMDKSLERRHRAAVWTRWGSTQAINAGDALYALANLVCVRLLNTATPPDKIARAVQTLSQACLWTAQGQILDIDFETREDVSPADYITMISHKTGTLIEAAAEIGALLSTDNEATIQAYARFGRHLGIAFQIRDDYLGMWGDEARTGKSATSDIREKKKSYPILVGFERASDTDRAALRRLYAQETLSDRDIQPVLVILNRAGAAAQTEQVAEQYYR